MNARFMMAGIVVVTMIACNNSTKSGGQGGTTSSGGTPRSGGISGAGGISSSGGSIATGGSPSSGGVTGKGGATGSGGTTSPDGGIPKGGVSGKGGTTSGGGNIDAGVTTAKGGATGKGGTNGKGGANGSGGSTGATSCTREMLQTAVEAYIAAMKAGDSSSLPLTASATYTENDTKSQFGQGLWATPLTPDQTMNLLDVEKCGSYTEVIIASGGHPYVLGIRLTVAGGQISAVKVLATDCDDWGFDAKNYLKYAKAELANTAAGSGWGLVPADDRFTSEELIAAGDAYFAYWGDKTVEVPWGYPCSRLEGGMATNPDPNPRKDSTCSIGIPDQTFAPKPTDHLVDVDYGMVVVFVGLPGPDSHWFRFTKSTLMRYIHTLTICYVNGSWQCPGSAPVCK
jgi:hypothetical protein